MVRATWFEIPVVDLERAIDFYERVLLVELERDVVDGHDAAYFPAVDGPVGAAGALMHGESYVPSADGTRVYLGVDDLEGVLERAVAAGGQVLYPATEVAGTVVAEISDSEGNRVALQSELDDD
ncbi:MAG: VOC family protein [Candidatus Nanopelagicales bacterium]